LRDIVDLFDSCLFSALYGNVASSAKPEVHNNYIALPSEEDRATATGNIVVFLWDKAIARTVSSQLLGFCFLFFLLYLSLCRALD